MSRCRLGPAVRFTVLGTTRRSSSAVSGAAVCAVEAKLGPGSDARVDAVGVAEVGGDGVLAAARAAPEVLLPLPAAEHGSQVLPQVHGVRHAAVRDAGRGRGVARLQASRALPRRRRRIVVVGTRPRCCSGGGVTTSTRTRTVAQRSPARCGVGATNTATRPRIGVCRGRRRRGFGAAYSLVRPPVLLLVLVV